MKTRDFIALLEKNGWKFLRHGSNHDIYTNGAAIESVPRHSEMKENTAKAIIKGNTAQRLCARCAVRFFARLCQFDADRLTPVKENWCNMAENMQAYCVQSRKAVFVRCCLKEEISNKELWRCLMKRTYPILLMHDEPGFVVYIPLSTT